MLFNGEQVGDGDGRRVRRRGRPHRRHHADGQGHAQRDRGHGRRRPRRHVRPVRRLLHGEDRDRAGRRRRRRHHRAGRREHPPGGQGQAQLAPATSPSASSTGRGTSSWSREVREAGARIKFITDGDVAGAIAAAREGTGVDLLLGIGGTPEGIIAACALKCMGGALQGRLWPQDDDERQKAIDAGHDLDRVLHLDDLVRGDVFFVATGITDGELLRGVQYRAGGCTTQSLVMRSKSGTIRSIDSLHSLEKLRAYSAVPSRSGRTEQA